MNINLALNKGIKILKKNFISTPQLDSELLLSSVLKTDRKNIIINQNDELDLKSYYKFETLIYQRSKKKPIAYLIGRKDFWNHQFKIKEGVLIPRPDTEIIVDQVLKITKNKSNLNILEIGLGSGCLLLSILKEKKFFSGIGIDISKKSIEISKINAADLKLLNRVKLIKSDVDNFVYGKYDLIISNPPYINKLGFNYLESDINFEPKIALNGGIDGLSVVRKVIDKSSKLIKKWKVNIRNSLTKKHNKKIVDKKGFYINKIVKDYANNDRCIVSTKI